MDLARSLLATLLACHGLAAVASEPPPAPASRKPRPNALAAPTTCDTTTQPSYNSQFPAGFDYPQQTQSWVTSGGGARMRLHAWCLFAGLNQGVPGGPPLWQTWMTSTQAFPWQYNPWRGGAVGAAGKPGTTGTPAAAARRPAPLNAKNLANARVGGLNAINNPAPVYGVNAAVATNPAYQACLEPIAGTTPQLYQLKDGSHFQSNGDIMVAGVVYNYAALLNIYGTPLFDAGALDGRLPAQPTSPAVAIPPFPSDSIVLKPMFWPVAQGGYTALPIWDWEQHLPGSKDDGQYAGYEMQALWSRAVAITDVAKPQPPSQLQFLYGVLDSSGKKQLGPNTYQQPQFEVVPIQRFYYRQYQQRDLDGLSDCDRAILDASAWWAYNRGFQAGDYVALVAMHIMTKEQPSWTFQSLWWHPDALGCKNKSRFCGGWPTNVGTTFQNYMLTTTYGTTQDKGHDNYYAPPNTKGPVWPVAYNPYIELAASHPITTNCMNCHHRAAWPPRSGVHSPDEQRTSTYLQDNPPNPNPLEVFDFTNDVFDGLVMLDSMWAVSDRAGYSDPANPARPAPPAAPASASAQPKKPGGTND